MEEIAEVIENIDNIIAAISLPMSAEIHLEALKVALPEVRDQLKDYYLAAGGENYWD